MTNVFLCTAPSANSLSIPDSKIWLKNLQNGFLDLGAKVLLPSFDTHKYMQECRGYADGVDPEEAKWRYSELLFDEVRKAHRSQGLSLFMGYLWNTHVLPETIIHIGELGVPTVLFYCNAVHQFHLISEIAPAFDYCLVPEKKALNKYKSIGANPLHIQMAADPALYSSSRVNPYYKVSFIGARYLYRSDYIAYLAWNGIDVRIWGPGWKELKEYVDNLPLHRKVRRKIGNMKRRAQKHLNISPRDYPLPYEAFGPILSDKEMVDVIATSQISLNFSEVKDEFTGEVNKHIRLRDFEVPMTGGLLFTGYQDELRTYYRVNKEIVCYENKYELLDKCKYYLKHQDEAEKIRLAGHMRARREHKWSNRFELLFSHIGITI